MIHKVYVLYDRVTKRYVRGTSFKHLAPLGEMGRIFESKNGAKKAQAWGMYQIERQDHNIVVTEFELVHGRIIE